MTAQEFAQARLTYIENWPDQLHELSIRQVEIPLSLLEARALGASIRHFGHWFGDCSPLLLQGIANRLASALRAFPEGAFVRLGSRSGKDSDFAQASGMRIASSRGALLMLTDGSERLAYDLRLALSFAYCPHIFVRAWHSFPEWAEFRCFMRGRQLVGISQYNCINLGPCPELLAREATVRMAILTFFEEFREVVHLDDVVFDVFLEDAENPQASRVRLLELNPFSPRTDACLFRWTHARTVGGDFDGSFRYVRR